MKPINPINHPICFAYPLRTAPSAWTRHIPFGLCLIDLLRPNIVVELGTARGDSYCAFCQAVKDLGLETRCFAVDTWQDDEHGGLAGPKALADLRAHHDPRYGTFSRIIQATFDHALGRFADGAIDLLHVDGDRASASMSHDVDRWLPKMSERGVILLHNINGRTQTPNVRTWFEEKKRHYPHFEFLHGHGLGILAVGQRYPAPLRELLEAPEETWPAIRACFLQLGLRIEVQTELENTRALRPAPNRSDGVRPVNLTLAAVYLLFTKGPVATSKRILLWLGGTRGYWKQLRATARPAAPPPESPPVQASPGDEAVSTHEDALDREPAEIAE